MAFAINDLTDLKQLLVEHPEWRAELRNLILAEDFQALPAIVRDLAESVRELTEAQRRSEQRLTRLEEGQVRLERGQGQLEQRLTQVEDRLTRLEETVAQLAEAQRRTEERLIRLEETVAQLAEAQRRAEERIHRLEDRVGQMDGILLEQQYQRKAPAHFGRWIRRMAVVDNDELFDRFETQLSPEEFHRVLLTDFIARGRVAALPGGPEVWLAVEVSSVIDRGDVDRALDRAELLRRGGVLTVPVVAGRAVTGSARREAQERGVAILQDGTVLLWDEALAAWSS